MASLEPPPRFMGGYAEDALLAGTVTRRHADLDWIFPRRELDVRLAQPERLGFSGFRTVGEAAPGAAPLALNQIRIAIAGKGSFGQLSERQRESSRLLREKFFPDRTEAELEPVIEPLS
jgi:hypothetical protein